LNTENEIFNANDFFDNAAGTPNSDKKHDFGYTIAGQSSFRGYNTARENLFLLVPEWRRERDPFSFNQQCRPG